MLEAIVSGIVQGITEWLPVSSEGILVLLKTKVFQSSDSLDLIIKQVLFLHLGTFFAALIYFRQYVWSLTKTLFNYGSAQQSKQQVLKFLLISTLISGVLGFFLLKSFTYLGDMSEAAAKSITLIIGFLLLVTAVLQYRMPSRGYKSLGDVKNKDSILLGVMQGLAALPGLSRSGLTVSALLLRKFDRRPALELSFLMSLPIVLGGNIILNFKDLVLSGTNLVGLIFSFVFGILTIGLLLKIAKKVNFCYFVFIFGLLTIVSAFI